MACVAGQVARWRCPAWAAAAGGSLSALAVILALFMIGYVLWTTDQLTALVRATAAAASGAVRDQSGIPAVAAGASGVAGMRDATGAAGAVLPGLLTGRAVPGSRPGSPRVTRSRWA
jgi:hypothetical protein